LEGEPDVKDPKILGRFGEQLSGDVPMLPSVLTVIMKSGRSFPFVMAHEDATAFVMHYDKMVEEHPNNQHKVMLGIGAPGRPVIFRVKLGEVAGVLVGPLPTQQEPEDENDSGNGKLLQIADGDKAD
jgi:hypothetical protein